jgi:hypothetical protein
MKARNIISYGGILFLSNASHSIKFDEAQNLPRKINISLRDTDALRTLSCKSCNFRKRVRKVIKKAK